MTAAILTPLMSLDLCSMARGYLAGLRTLSHKSIEMA
jgi:hypothetical protein